jgi:hypothetical protein
MATCAVAGQAAGTAAALCAKEGLLPRQIAGDPARVARLQQTLLRDDQTLRGVRNEDPADLARRARASASSEEPHAPSSNVVDGWVRDIPNKEIHQWQGRMAAAGAWIELRWDAPVRISQVQLTFDTGFQRELTLTSNDGVNKGTIRAPQPETVKDYRILAGAKVVAEVKGNIQRLNRSNFEPVTTDRLRIEVQATNGSDLARIFEVRCYA